ncbi:Sodium/calcium exchanger protein-domain-containing protein [Bombardia bombarda]|uniref:Sodium/calcium exchanger protein-domain-containing protein n=1 Tax=Bombardia bombarda TaxID=252184 RepID=A0AA39WMI7_9PEZI|nr:Sodium/calcium exchanger protein-domain-containing protein [Bombardia bombarda]
MPAPRSKRSRYSSRPFVVSLLLITVIATCALLLPRSSAATQQYQHQHQRHHARLTTRKPQEADLECRAVHQAVDQCAFVLANCKDDEAGLVSYLTFYYCHLNNARPVAFAILAIWLGLLFTTIGIAASDFFSVNLSTISSVLGLSESLAGVTFLAFGNGSPDVFSTFAAMGSNSGSMAVGELLGAAGFITAVVAGSMALVREFKVSKRTFVRDIVFFIVAISFSMVFLADGELHLWECCIMIGFYLFYVIVVVGWHWFSVRRRRQRLREAASRAHFFGSGRATEELEPYRDDPDEDDVAPVGRSRSAPEAADISILERGPRIEVDGPGLPVTPSDEDDEERGFQVAAEMTSSMRVNRPRWGRSNTTITPIRPSLVGVLEFRSVLSALQRERNVHMLPLPGRGYSDYHVQPGLERSATFSLEDSRGRSRNETSPLLAQSPARERALSSGNLPLNLQDSDFTQPDVESNDRPNTRGSSTTRTVDGRLAPPSGYSMAVDHATSQTATPTKHSKYLQIRIPSPGGGSSGQTSPSLSAFPTLSESPLALTPHPGHPTSAYSFPVPQERRHSSVVGLTQEPKPVKWWPYQVLPPPHVLFSTIFPTLQGWRNKSIWDKILSLVSVPSIFILVTTLPVVEGEPLEEDSTPELDAALEVVNQPQNPTLPVTAEEDPFIPPESAWQEYRRRTKSVVSLRSPMSLTPSLIDFTGAATSASGGNAAQLNRQPSFEISSPPSRKPTAGEELEQAAISAGESTGWNRWLVALQLITGPQFVVAVIWANMYEDVEQAGKVLLRLVLYALLFSLCLLVVLLLTTTPEKKPKYHFLLCFLGFVISVAWISTIAGEVVGVLKAIGVILGISEAILGLTIFAVGNSLGDLVADVTVARLGYPVMALAACFGGPMLNILLGVGIGGAWMTISSAGEKHKQHPNKPLRYKPYRIQVGGTLMVSAFTVLLTLIALLIVVPSNKWVMSRKIGWGLIGIWTVSTIVNLVVEISGAWADVS